LESKSIDIILGMD
jgi:hypothetical protein